MRDPIKNLSHILISRNVDDLIPAFIIGDTEFMVYPRIPAEAIIRLTTSDNQIVGMRDYVLSCLGQDDQKTEFEMLMGRIDIDGLGAIVEEIVSKTSPFDGAKPSE
jgi:hypothetical protein